MVVHLYSADFKTPVVRGSGLSAGISSRQIELLSRVGVIAAEFSYALLVLGPIRFDIAGLWSRV
jgi:hypothetical protein